MSTTVQIASELLKQAEISYKNEQNFSDETLLNLHSIYGETFIRALDLMDIGKFVLYTTENKTRKLLKIKGKNEEYTLFQDVNYCPCLAFKYQVLIHQKCLTCKHILAGKLMTISGKITEEIITGQQMSGVIQNLIPNDDK